MNLSKTMFATASEPDPRHASYVYRKGGSIGYNSAGWSHLAHGKHVETFEDPAMAKALVKRYNAQLSPGEKGYYGIKYHVKGDAPTHKDGKPQQFAASSLELQSQQLAQFGAVPRSFAAGKSKEDWSPHRYSDEGPFNKGHEHLAGSLSDADTLGNDDVHVAVNRSSGSWSAAPRDIYEGLARSHAYLAGLHKKAGLHKEAAWHAKATKYYVNIAKHSNKNHIEDSEKGYDM